MIEISCFSISREYETRIAELQEQFGREQADKSKLQQELDQLQKDWDTQLTEAHVSLFNIHVPQCLINGPT